MISCGKKTVIMAAKESDLLMLLADKNIKNYNLLLQKLGNINKEALWEHIKNLRRKVRDVSGNNYIKTIHGEGLRLLDTPTS